MQETTQAPANGYDDEIDIGELVASLWRQRGLILGVMLFTTLAVLAFHASKATFSSAQKIDYAFSVTFENKGTYPNGNVFTAQDIVANSNIKSTLEKLEINKPVGAVASALSIRQSNALLEISEQKLSDILANTKNPADVAQAANEALADMRNRSRGFFTLSVNLSEAELTSEQGQALVVGVVEQWAQSSIKQGLANGDISRPFSAFEFHEDGSIIDIFESAVSYLDALITASDALAKKPGSSTIIVNGQTLGDLQRTLNQMHRYDVVPLRQFAYNNSGLLAQKNPLIEVRLASAERLLRLDHKRLTQRLAFYKQTMSQLATETTSQSKKTKSSAYMGESTMDDSFLKSMIELGATLGSVEVREALIKEQIAINDEILGVEKQIAILEGANVYKGNTDPETVLKEAIAKIAKDLNRHKTQLNDLLQAYSQQVMQSSGRLYNPDTGVEVRGGGIQLGKKIALHSVLGLILGGMLGVALALLRAAIVNARKELSA